MEEDENAEVGLKGNGVLPNTSTCYVHAETFQLLPHSLRRTVAGLNRTHIVLPSSGALIKPNEQELLQTQLNFSVHLRKIDDVIEEVIRTELDVTAVLENLRQVEPAPNTSMYWMTGISVCSLLLTRVCCYYKKSLRDWSRIIRQHPIPQPRQRNAMGISRSSEYASTIDTVLPLKVIAADPSGGEPEEAETQLNENDRILPPSCLEGRSREFKCQSSRAERRRTRRS
jgi:hypothetical protein